MKNSFIKGSDKKCILNNKFQKKNGESLEKREKVIGYELHILQTDKMEREKNEKERINEWKKGSIKHEQIRKKERERMRKREEGNERRAMKTMNR